MLTTLESNVRGLFVCNVMYHSRHSVFHPTVPMDLDVKMKATMLAACFLIVSKSHSSNNY